MNLKEIITKYKEGNSIDRLGIIGNVVTIISTIVALVTGQLLTLKFIVDETTFIAIAFYIIAMGISLLVFFLFLKILSLIINLYKSYLIQAALFLIILGIMLLVLVIIWSFVLIPK